MRFRHLCCVVATISFLTACGATTSGSLSKIPDSNHGIVIADVLNNSRFIPESVLGWSEIIVEKVDDNSGKSFSLKGTKQWDFSQKLKYAGGLPPGTYRIKSLYYFKQTDGYAAISEAQIPGYLGTFEVTANSVTNLGTIVYHPLFTPHFLEKDLGKPSLISRMSNPDLPTTVAKDLRNWAGVLDQTNYLTWSADQSDEIRAQALELIKSADMPYSTLRAGENLFIFGKMGGVHLFDGQSMTHMTLPFQGQIVDIAETSSGNFVLRTANDSIFWVDKRFKKSKRISKLDGEDIQKVLNHDGKTLVVSLMPQKSLTIYEYHELNGLTGLKKYDLNSLAGNIKNQLASVFSTGSTMKILIGQNELRFDADESKWTETVQRKEVRVFYEKEGVVFGAEPSSWSGIGDTQYSLDGGLTWHQTTVKNNAMYRDQSGNLYYVHDGYDIEFLAGSSIHDNVNIFKSSDKGKTWFTNGKLPRLCNRLMPNHSNDSRLLVACVNGNIIQSSDLGKSWRAFFDRKRLSRGDLPASMPL